MKASVVVVSLLVVVVVGCAKKKDEAKPPPPPAVASGSAPVAPPDAAAPTPKAELLPAKLEGKDAIVFAEQAGGQVAATTVKGGGTVSIPDLTHVRVVKEGEPAAESGEDVSVEVDYEGATVAVRADRVIQEASLVRGPDGKHAVFRTIYACGDLCHSVFYLLDTDNKRTKLGEGGPDVVVAWGKDAVAVGSGGLAVASLVDGSVKQHDGYTAPAYAPDGTLYVRDASGAAFTLAGDTAKRVWKPKKQAKTDDDGMPADDPSPVTFDAAGKPKFELE